MPTPEEIEVATGAGFAAWGAKTLLGPSLERIGHELPKLPGRAMDNVGAVIRNATAKVGDGDSGDVPPRVWRRVLTEAQDADDEVMVEYLGGVLASSRSEVDRDDRGAVMSALVGRLSTYQLRAHYVLYAAARPGVLRCPSEVNLRAHIGQQQHRKVQTRSYISFTDFALAMDFSDREAGDFSGLLTHITSGLTREALIEDEFCFGGPEHLRQNGGGGAKAYDAGGGIIFALSPLGIELFCVAHGRREAPFHLYLDPAIALNATMDVNFGRGAHRVLDMPPEPPPDPPNHSLGPNQPSESE